MFAQVAFQPTPELAPPKPVYQSVAAAAFMQALQIVTPLVGGMTGTSSTGGI